MLEGSILKQLVDSQDLMPHQGAPLNFGVYYKNTLVALCHALEDCILASDCAPLVITAFQQGKWYLQEADRYGAIANQAHQIVIMAAPNTGFHDHPTSQRANVALVDLQSSDPVSQEWHLMILAPTYAAMVLCQELQPDEYGPQGPPDNDLLRKFYGFWTFDPQLVLETVQRTIHHIKPYDAALASRLQQQVDAMDLEMTTAAEAMAAGLKTVVERVVDYLQTCRQATAAQDNLTQLQDLDDNLTSNELQAFLRMAQLVDLLDPLNPMAAAEVASLAEMVGQLIDLPAWQLRRLRLASYLHRIAPLPEPGPLANQAPSCPLAPGAQALRTLPRLRAVAQIINHQTEWWNGQGYPAGLERDSIPLESRILGLMQAFQARLATNRADNSAQAPSSPEADGDGLQQALAACQTEAGERWDPKLVEILNLLVQGLQQGLSLPAIPLKLSLGSGLLQSDTDTALTP